MENEFIKGYTKEEFMELDLEPQILLLMDKGCTITTKQTLKEYAIENINEGLYQLAINVLNALNDFPEYMYFDYDFTKGLLDTPSPIRNKCDLEEYGYL